MYMSIDICIYLYINMYEHMQNKYGIGCVAKLYFLL